MNTVDLYLFRGQIAKITAAQREEFNTALLPKSIKNESNKNCIKSADYEGRGEAGIHG